MVEAPIVASVQWWLCAPGGLCFRSALIFNDQATSSGFRTQVDSVHVLHW